MAHLDENVVTIDVHLSAADRGETNAALSSAETIGDRLSLDNTEQIDAHA